MTHQGHKASLPIRQNLTLTCALAFIFVILVISTPLTTLVEPLAWGSPAPGDHPPVGTACTSFCLNNSGRAVFGSNYDNAIWEGLLFVNKRGVTKTNWESSTTGKYAQWTAEYGSVTFNLFGIQMAWAGMNEVGLVISTMALEETRHPAPDERPSLLPPMWVQYQLDTCATLEEVMANDTRVRITDAVDHYLVCDRSGACAAVEFLEGKTTFHIGDAMPVNALTNSPYLKSVEAWQADQLQNNSLERFGMAADRVTNFQPRDTPAAVDYAFETLNQVSFPATASSPTQWSIVFDVEDLRIHFHTSRNPQIRSVDFSQLDFACGTPVEMLDVHAPLSGDISDQLGQYTFEANLQHTLNFLEKFKWDISPLEVEVLERGVASFPCEQPAAPYQEEKELMISPLVGWVALALLHRLWPVGVAVGLGVAALIIWRVWVRSRRG